MSRMGTDLTTSPTHRQNILNNPYALAEIEKAIGIRGIEFQGRRVVLLDQVAFFFQVNRRTIERCVADNKTELERNGYAVARGNDLILLKESIAREHGTDIDVGTIKRASVLAIFDFRALTNIAMLLTDSDRARVLRQAANLAHPRHHDHSNGSSKRQRDIAPREPSAVPGGYSHPR